MASKADSRMRELETVCRRLSAARRGVEELEQRRDALIRELRTAGVSGSRIAELVGLSPGRVSQISDHHGTRPQARR